MFQKVNLIVALLMCWMMPAYAADSTHNIKVGGDERAFLVHIPDSLAGKQELPVVMVFHGGGGEAQQVRRQTRMDAVADKNGFMAVYPEGTGAPLMQKMKTWNAGLCCGVAARKKVDDMAFVSAMIDALADEYKIDTKRVYATGHSNGAQISYRLSCELSDKIAAIAPNAGSPVNGDCKPTRAVPILHIHGTEDPCVPYEGGSTCGGCFSKALGISIKGDHWPCPAVRGTVAARAKMNGCGGETEITYTKGAATCEKFSGCPANADVALCSIAGAGHVWPGGQERPKACDRNAEGKGCTKYASIVGQPTPDLDASQMAWDFFKDKHL